jgi:PAS domain S-box-containing protein
VSDHVPRRLTEEQVASLRALARQAMAQLELRRRAAELRSLLDEKERDHDAQRRRIVSASAHHATLMDLARMDPSDFAAFVGTLTRRVADVLGVARVGVWLLDGDGGLMDCADLFDAQEGRHTCGTRIERDRYPRYFSALESHRVLAAHDARADARTAELRAGYLVPLGITSMLDAPVWRGGRVAGVVCHEHVGPAREWSNEEQDFALSVADMVSLALEARDRQQAAAALRASGASYRAIFDLSNDAIFVHDVDTFGVVDVNRKACEEHGYTRDELARLELGALSAADAANSKDLLLHRFRLARDGEPQTFEWLERIRDGPHLWKEVSLRRVAINGRDRLLATARDITDRRRAAEALRRGARRPRTAGGRARAGGLDVHADRQRLTQVLLNLLSNAVKYNRPRGVVRVACEVVDGPDGARPHIRVHDTGRGIPTEKLDRLFVPFERLGAEQTEMEGTGLGLALSKRLVEAMGGDLRVESVPGAGSTFTLELPLVDSPLERLRPAAAGGDAPGGTVEPAGTVLYIEDNLANLSLIEAILAGRPAITLIPALQGRLGLDLAWEHAPDVILLDLHLPDVSGEEVLARLRADARTRETPVIVISADAMPGRSERLTQAGAHAYLTKPLDVDLFIRTIDRLLAEHAR